MFMRRRYRKWIVVVDVAGSKPEVSVVLVRRLYYHVWRELQCSSLVTSQRVYAFT